MYQLAADCRKPDKAVLFLETCTAMAPTPENLHLVRSATALMRGALHGADVKPLRDFVRRISSWCSDADDVVVAAGQAVLDELDHLSRVGLHDAVHRVAQIERDALAAGARRDMDGNFRTAYAS